MTAYPQDDSQQFARLLLKDGLIRQEDWQIAESIQKVQGGRLLEILLGLCPLSEEDLYRAIARQLDFPFWTEQDLLHLEIPDAILLQFPVTIALECDFLPIKWDEYKRRLHIVLSNPLDSHTLDAIRSYAQADELVLGVATPSDVVTAIQVHYKQGSRSLESPATQDPFYQEELPEDTFPPVNSTSHSIPPPKIQLRACPACQNMEPLDVEICTRCTSPMNLSEADPFLLKEIKGFQLTHKLGEGGMGLVYGARHIETGQEAAVKILRTHLSSNERVVRRFHREAQAQNQLQHPNIVHVHDFGFEQGIGFFIAMEFLRGLSMEEILESHMDRLTPRFIRTVIQQVCDAMGLAHSHGIFHRDLKPDNIFLLEPSDPLHPHVKLLDFGVAKMVASEEDERLTRTGMTIGTPRYMAPEQAGDGNTDHRSDIYSLGVIMFEMLTGKPPFEGSSAYQIMLRHVYADPPPLSHLRPDLPFPPELEDFILRVLAKDPQHRPASMDIFWQELEPLFDRFETYIDPTMPLHTPSGEPFRSGSSAASISSEPPVLVGRIAPQQKSPAPEPFAPQSTPYANWAPPPEREAEAPPSAFPSQERPPMAQQNNDFRWIQEGEIDLWESNLKFADSQESQPPERQPMPNPLSNSRYNDTPNAANYDPFADEPMSEADPEPSFNPFGPPEVDPDPSFNPFAAPKAPRTPPPASAAPFSVPNYRPPQEREPRQSGPQRLSSRPPSTPASQRESGDQLPAAPPQIKPITKPLGNISLRSGPGRPGQRNRFSNALKQKPKDEEKPRYLLLAILGILLFGGGLVATWLFLMRGG